MAYTTGNMNLTSMAPLSSSVKIWLYTTADSEATVKGAGYVSDATNKGMKKGDIVWVVNQSTPAVYLLQVASITAGAGALGATVVVT